MPPIAPSPQGSRAGLITALVIFVILFVVSTIMAIHFGTQWDAAEKKNAIDMQNISRAVAPASLTSSKEVADLLEAAAKKPPMTAIDLAIQQRNEMDKILSGNPTASVDGVKADTQRVIAASNEDLSKNKQTVTLSEDNVLADIRTLTGQIAALSNALDEAQKRAAEAEKKAADETAARAAALADKDKAIADEQKKVADALAQSQTRESGIAANVKSIQDSATKAMTDSATQLAAAQAEITKLQGDLKKALDQYQKAISTLNKYRLNPSRALLRPAGIVTRIPGNNTVFINLGEGEEISPGLTFEVYDKHKGLPSLTALNPENPDELAAGKASIEVMRTVGPASECRIVRLAPGQQIVEGDLILNLVYNTHTKFAFAVFGDFDLAGTGQANPADTEVIKRLISQWGGRVMDQITVDTDFLVLGKEPTVLPLPDNPTPVDQERHDKQQKALDNYEDRRTAATKLNIPILNQTRFLYFVGYYDQAKR